MTDFQADTTSDIRVSFVENSFSISLTITFEDPNKGEVFLKSKDTRNTVSNVTTSLTPKANISTMKRLKHFMTNLVHPVTIHSKTRTIMVRTYQSF